MPTDEEITTVYDLGAIQAKSDKAAQMGMRRSSRKPDMKKDDQIPAELFPDCIIGGALAGCLQRSSGEKVTISATAEGETIAEMFEPQILAYLNARGDAQGLQAALSQLTLTDSDGQDWQARTQVFTTDVTGDTTPEVIIDLRFFIESQFADGALFVFHCQAREYVGVVSTALDSLTTPRRIYVRSSEKDGHTQYLSMSSMR